MLPPKKGEIDTLQHFVICLKPHIFSSHNVFIKSFYFQKSVSFILFTGLCMFKENNSYFQYVSVNKCSCLAEEASLQRIKLPNKPSNLKV